MPRALCLLAALAVTAVLPASATAATTDDYRGLAAWVDVFDPGPWEQPERWMQEFAGNGVSTVFVQTSNYKLPYAIHRRGRLARLLRAGDREGIDVIAWYLPGFDRPQRDWRRVKAAVTFASPAGDRFDGFALDIEATAVRDIATRNRRMVALSTRLRELVGPEYALGAIVPDPVTQTYWPGFPWGVVRERFDVVLPMLYWTFRTAGRARVCSYAERALRLIRAGTGDPSVPVHLIGGIASDASNSEVRGFARAAVDFGAAGASLYDAPITRPGQWTGMMHVGRLTSN